MVLQQLGQIGRHNDHVDGIDEFGVDELVRNLVHSIFVGQEVELDVL